MVSYNGFPQGQKLRQSEIIKPGLGTNINCKAFWFDERILVIFKLILLSIVELFLSHFFKGEFFSFKKNLQEINPWLGTN